MKKQFAYGFVPYELDDSVKLKDDDRTWKVNELRFTQHVRAQTAVMELQLITGETEIWVTVDKIKNRIIDPKNEK